MNIRLELISIIQYIMDSLWFFQKIKLFFYFTLPVFVGSESVGIISKGVIQLISSLIKIIKTSHHEDKKFCYLESEVRGRLNHSATTRTKIIIYSLKLFLKCTVEQNSK